jgi:hypothetical protein
VALFRKQETYNEQMLREAGLDRIQLEQPTVLEELGIPIGRPKDDQAKWAVAMTLTAPGLPGEKIAFTTLPDGDVIVDEEDGDADISPLADAVETRLKPPYKALSARQRGDLWAVVANPIEVASIPFPKGDELELSRKDSWDELRVDGQPSDARIPQLARLGEQAGPDFFVKAERIDGDFWEVRVSAL